MGQSLWLDNITRDLLNDGTLKRYIAGLSVTGLTSNPTIFDHAIKNSSSYDSAIREIAAKGKTGEELFFELALEDITGAADLFRPICDRTNGADGWVSLEVSPLLAHNTASTLAEVRQLFARVDRPNLLVKIPGTKEGLLLSRRPPLQVFQSTLLSLTPPSGSAPSTKVRCRSGYSGRVRAQRIQLRPIRFTSKVWLHHPP
jgi:transaldolase